MLQLSLMTLAGIRPDKVKTFLDITGLNIHDIHQCVGLQRNQWGLFYAKLQNMYNENQLVADNPEWRESVKLTEGNMELIKIIYSNFGLDQLPRATRPMRVSKASIKRLIQQAE